MSSSVVAAIISATNFAAIKHKDQKRKDPEGTPYINHPVGVAYILTEVGKTPLYLDKSKNWYFSNIQAGIDDVEVIQGAILHDTVEDTDTTLDEIEAEFGKAVRDIVDEVTDDKDLEKLERKRLQIVHAKNASEKVRQI